MSKSILWEKEEKYQLSSAEFAQRVIQVNGLGVIKRDLSIEDPHKPVYLV